MEDLISQMQTLLNSKEGQEQLKGLTSMLGGENGEMPDLSSLAGLFSGSENAQPQEKPSSPQQPDGLNLDMNMLFQVQKALSSMNQKDTNVELLMALKPHFREERQTKVDQAVKMLRLFSVLPMLKDSGLLGGLLGDGK